MQVWAAVVYYETAGEQAVDMQSSIKAPVTTTYAAASHRSRLREARPGDVCPNKLIYTEQE